MFPSKSMVEYMIEMNRLFPGACENDANLFNPGMSPFHCTTANRSSSSADSTSPDSFDIPMPFRHDAYPRHDLTPIRETSRPMFDTPRPDSLQVRRRPIVGRKLLLNTEHVDQKFDELQSIWQDDLVPLQETPPSVEAFPRTGPSVCYELFPSETRAYEFRTPVKNQLTPRTSISPLTNASSNYSHSPPIRMSYHQFSKSPTSFSQASNIEAGNICTFCKKNGETPMVYTTHVVKERVGNKQVVSCPILRSHVCTTCGASGDDAHTITYCPVLRRSNNGRPLASTTITLKNTRVKSNGRRRF